MPEARLGLLPTVERENYGWAEEAKRQVLEQLCSQLQKNKGSQSETPALPHRADDRDTAQDEEASVHCLSRR